MFRSRSFGDASEHCAHLRRACHAVRALRPLVVSRAPQNPGRRASGLRCSSMASGREATRVISKDGHTVARFVRACRLAMKLPDGSELSRDFAQPVVRAGAQAGNDLLIADEAVSRIHFEIVAEPMGFRLRDLGSTNGT